MAKRALTTPADLQKYQPSVISAACSMQATPYTSTTTATVTASTSTSIIPVVVTATASPIPVNAPTCDIAVARFGSYNRGGCVYCYCNAATDGIARCVDDMSSGTYCTANADCPAGEFCDIGDIKNPGRGYCSSGKSCSSTFGSGVSPRDLPAVAGMPRLDRMHQKRAGAVVGPNALAVLSIVQADEVPTTLPSNIAAAMTSIASAAAAASATSSS
jgi:Cys-rich repeat protein